MKIYKNFKSLIGKTPLLEIVNYTHYNGIEAKILAKLEYFNPGGSTKDRVAAAMINDAEEKGLLKSYEREYAGKTRKYYSITKEGRGLLEKKKAEWNEYRIAVSSVLAFSY